MRASFLGVALLAVGCGVLDSSDESGSGYASGGGAPPPPSQPPPTGGRWKGVSVENECGRKTVEWVVVDETCGDVGSERYLDPFEAPMFRDGTVLDGPAGPLMYAVDGSALWVLDVTDPASMARKALRFGFGRPLAVARHAGRLVIAAADSGLVVASAADPLDPVVEARVDLPGVALDVHVDGDRAYVAAGAGGLAVVDLATDPPAVVETIDVPGFAAGVVARDGRAYVAACSTLAVVDLAAGSAISSAWVDEPYDGDVLVAPAKDVEVVGDVAFVAAGRFGAVAVDVSNPETPSVLGNCTLADEPSFYASGVRAEAGSLFIAGGEWGALRVGADDAPAACEAMVLPSRPPPPAGSGGCSADPPWDVVPWQDRWAPPPPPPPPRHEEEWPPFSDPIQVLPAGDVLYAFGDARRIALRAVLAEDPKSDVLAQIGRYDEPRLVDDVAARAGRLLVAGKGGGLFDVAEDGSLTAGDLPVARESVAGELLPDGRWVLATEEGELAIEGAEPLKLSSKVWPRGLAVRGDEIAVPTESSVLLFDAEGTQVAELSNGRVAQLPPAIAVAGSDVIVAAPEWTDTVVLDGAGVRALPPHGLFDADEILDAGLWQSGIPRRLLVPTGNGIVEVASLGGRSGLLDRETGGALSLPEGTYTGGAWADGRVHLATTDRGRYRSEIVTVALGRPGPRVESVESFAGVATDVATDGTRLFVGDADGAIRVYDLDGGRPRPLLVRRLEESRGAG